MVPVLHGGACGHGASVRLLVLWWVFWGSWMHIRTDGEPSREESVANGPKANYSGGHVSAYSKPSSLSDKFPILRLVPCVGGVGFMCA